MGGYLEARISSCDRVPVKCVGYVALRLLLGFLHGHQKPCIFLLDPAGSFLPHGLGFSQRRRRGLVICLERQRQGRGDELHSCPTSETGVLHQSGKLCFPFPRLNPVVPSVSHVDGLSVSPYMRHTLPFA